MSQELTKKFEKQAQQFQEEIQNTINSLEKFQDLLLKKQQLEKAIAQTEQKINDLQEISEKEQQELLALKEELETFLKTEAQPFISNFKKLQKDLELLSRRVDGFEDRIERYRDAMTEKTTKIELFQQKNKKNIDENKNLIEQHQKNIDENKNLIEQHQKNIDKNRQKIFWLFVLNIIWAYLFFMK